jgi:hypothetical protein
MEPSLSYQGGWGCNNTNAGIPGSLGLMATALSPILVTDTLVSSF